MGRRVSSDPVYDGTIQTLQIDAGKKWNESTGEGAIASLNFSIIFAPKGARPGASVRLKLMVLKDAEGKARLDASGAPMYRGVPAPVEYFDRWRDNGKGAATRVTISRTWLLEEAEEGECETRPLATREHHDRDETTWSPVWKNSFANSLLERAVIKVVALEKETVQNGEIIWTKKSERKEQRAAECFSITRCRGYGDAWNQHRLDVAVPDQIGVRVYLYYTENGQECEQYVIDNWGNFPAVLHNHILSATQVCICGRQRVDTSNISDGYTHCELCRNEEECDRCGREGVRVKIFDGKRICPACEQMAEQVKYAEQKLEPAARQTIADEAKRLLSGKAIPREAGEVILACLPDAERDSARYAGFAWYYLCADGVFGSKFSPEALEFLTLLPVAQGNGLARMTGWLIGGGGRKVSECENSDYFWKTQVQGKDEMPDLHWNDPAPSCAVRLRGPIIPPKPKPPASNPKPPEKTTISASGIDLSQLFGGRARVKK